MPHSIGAPHRGDVFIISRGPVGQVVLHPPNTKPTDVSVACRLLPDQEVTLVISKPVRKDKALKELELKKVIFGIFCFDEQSSKFVRRSVDGKLLPLNLLAGRGVLLHIGNLEQELSEAA